MILTIARHAAITLFALATAGIQGASAQGANMVPAVQVFGSWGTYATGEGASRVCFAMSEPKERLPANLNRGPGHLYVSIRPADKVRGEVGVVLGFAARDSDPATATIGDRTFAMMKQGESLFLANPAEESAFIAALRQGSDLSVKLTSARGNAVTEVYSLSGFTRSWELAQKQCP